MRTMKMAIDCNAATERLLECARRRSAPDAVLKSHLDSCEPCLERWEAERELTTALRSIQVQACSLRSPDSARTAMMAEFAAHNREQGGKPAAHRWWWSLAAAAVLLISTVVVRDLTEPAALAPAAPVVAEEQTEPQQEGFIDVPFAPPLAKGELTRVVHTELQPAELASLGVNVDPTWTADLPADLLLGQDGFPRAVRFSKEFSGESDF